MNAQPQENWLEPLLEQRLRPLSAPDELWHRLHAPRPAVDPLRTVPVARVSLVALLAVILLTVAVWSTHRSPSPEDFALQALAQGSEDLDFRSDTVTDIRTWVKSQTGLDIPLPSRTPEAVRLTGVCAVRGGSTARGIAVAYRVRGHNAALVVSRSSHEASDGKHQFLKCESVGANRVSSWTMKGQLYTLAYAAHGDLKDECLLCHNGAEQLTLRN